MVSTSKLYQWIRLLVITLLILSILLFVYPTLYRFDKLDQKYPVKINRITGETQVLSGFGWVDVGRYDAAFEELKKYKEDIMSQLDSIMHEIENNRNLLKMEVINDLQGEMNQMSLLLQEEVITALEQQIEDATHDIQVFKTQGTDPDNYFGKGDTMETVKRIMGTPDSINAFEYSSEEWWGYGYSKVIFKNGKVDSWSNTSKNLRLK